MLQIRATHVAGIFLTVCASTFCAAATCRADVTPADYVTITPIREIGSSTDELAYTGSKINTESIKQQTLTTINAPGGDRYQFISYYDENAKLVVGRRKMLTAGWSDWYLRQTAFVPNSINDNHDVSSIGVDGDGYLHVSWGMHGNPMLYTRSTTSAFGDTSFVLAGDTIGNSAGLGYEMPHTSGITYPSFYNIPGNDDLLFSYRVGSSGDGDLQLVRWDNTANTWNAVHAATGGNPPLLAGTDTDVNGYPNYAAFDSQGNWHITWTWRDTGGYQTNHNIMYAWSPNQGVDWYRQDGTLYQESGVHAINESNAPPVVNIPEQSSLMNQTYMTTGPEDNVYVASYWAPNAASGDHLRQYMLAWQDGDTWRTSQITNRNPEYTNAEGVSQKITDSLLASYYMCRPTVAVDDHDRVIVIFNDWQRGKVITIAYSEDPDRDDWQLFDLPTDIMGRWEPSLDINRWKEDGVISLLYLPVGPSSGVASIFEWDAEAYFAAIAPAPGDANRDGLVDEDDAGRLATYWGATDRADGITWWEMGDFNNDHAINAVDAAILAANWDYVAAESTTVPEPSTLLLATFLVTAPLLIGRRRG